MEGAKHNDLLERNQKACQQIRELCRKLVYFRNLYRQNVYQGVDDLLMNMVTVWLDLTLVSCLKIIRLLEGEEAENDKIKA